MAIHNYEDGEFKEIRYSHTIKNLLECRLHGGRDFCFFGSLLYVRLPQ